MKFQHTLIYISCLLSLSCHKYLDKVPDKALAVPSTLDDYQKLLDNDLISNSVSPELGDISSDDVQFSSPTFAAFPAGGQNIYTWSTSTTSQYGNITADWGMPYQAIFYTNAVLDGLSKMTTDAVSQSNFNYIKGQALFYRAFHFFTLEETYGMPYKPASAASDLGICLKLSADLNEKTHRSSVKEVYERILEDLTTAKDLLPASVPSQTPSRASKPAVFALMARVSLEMQDYIKAAAFADSCLSLYSVLLDYNTINLAARATFAKPGPPEILFSCSEVFYGALPIDSTLFNSYDVNDLRKPAFFRTGNGAAPFLFFKASYGSTTTPWNGLATDEIYLIRAESNARLGHTDSAMADLNTLLSNRWTSGTFTDLTAASPDDALNLILEHRRKELVFRGLRWLDLRRLNQDIRFAKTLTRSINGQTFTLSPNDVRYTALIPQQEITMTGIQQNAR